MPTAPWANTPTIYKAASNGGGLTIWTPTTGKKFRLMGCKIWASTDLAGATNRNTLFLVDSGTGNIGGAIPFYCPTTAITTQPGNLLLANLEFPGDGYLSGAVNNSLNIGLANAITSGVLYAWAWGTEE